MYDSRQGQPEQLQVVLAGGLEAAVFDKAGIFSMDDSTGALLSRDNGSHYLSLASTLANEWTALTPEQREVLFTASVVSHLWHYDNDIAPQKVGCVQCNETIGEAEADFVYQDTAVQDNPASS